MVKKLKIVVKGNLIVVDWNQQTMLVKGVLDELGNKRNVAVMEKLFLFQKFYY